MYKVILTTCLLFFFLIGNATQKNSILHKHTTVIEIESLKKVTLKTSYKVEILNSFEEDANNIVVSYSPQHKITSLSVTLITADSKSKNYKKKDFNDFAADGSSVASDNRGLFLSINRNQYPYIIEVAYEKEISGTMFMPPWDPQQNNNQYVKEASLKIINTANADLRFENHNMPMPTGNDKTYNAFIKNIEPFDFESFNFNNLDYYPILEMFCKNFEFFNHKGSLNSWQNYGEFETKLLQQRNTLSELEIASIKKEIPIKDTKLEQAKAIYDYLQDNSRYVSVQLGIGGWEPQETGFTHQKKYGDCKALSLYTKALFEAYQIPAYYTNISSGKYNHINITKKPTARFNHVILTVPFEQDTVWLECTSQSNPFGYLGTFTSDRYALAVDGVNSKLIKTKAYTADENYNQSKYYINIKSADKIAVEIEKTLSGVVLQESGLMNFDHLTKIEQDNRLADINTINNFNINEYTVSPTSNEVVPQCEVTINGAIGSGFNTKGSRIFFKLDDFFSDQEIYFNEEERTKPIYLQYPFTNVDVIFISYPKNYSIEASVKPVKKVTDYGEFNIDYTVIDDNNIMITRKVIFNKGTYQVDEYESLKAFTKTIKKKDKEMVVFKVD